MNDRDAIYVQILHFGLLTLRSAAVMGNSQYCAVEAEHLHNLPSLVGELNELRHNYYFDKERTYYLDRLDRSTPGIDFLLARYDELWQQLNELRNSTDK